MILIKFCSDEFVKELNKNPEKIFLSKEFKAKDVWTDFLKNKNIKFPCEEIGTLRFFILRKGKDLGGWEKHVNSYQRITTISGEPSEVRSSRAPSGF